MRIMARKFLKVGKPALRIQCPGFLWPPPCCFFSRGFVLISNKDLVCSLADDLGTDGSNGLLRVRRASGFSTGFIMDFVSILMVEMSWFLFCPVGFKNDAPLNMEPKNSIRGLCESLRCVKTMVEFFNRKTCTPRAKITIALNKRFCQKELCTPFP